MTTKTILMVDDDPDIHMLLGARLSEAGFRTISAYDGLSCLASVRREVPDLIMLDIGLPAGDGETTLRSLRKLQHMVDVPVLVVSGQPKSAWAERMQTFGADGYIQKPVDPMQFVAQVKRMLAVHTEPAAPESATPPAINPGHTSLSCPHCGGAVGTLSNETVATLR